MPRPPGASTEHLYAPRRSRPPKLSPEQRDEIRRRIGEDEKPKALALEYGVSTNTIRSNS